MHQLVMEDVGTTAVGDMAHGHILESPIDQRTWTTLLVLARRPMPMAWLLLRHFLSQDARPEDSGAAAAAAVPEPAPSLQRMPLDAVVRSQRPAAVELGMLASTGIGRDVMTE